MISETEVEAMIADEILGMIKSKTNVKTFCIEYHIDRRKLTKKQIFRFRDSSMHRIMHGIGQIHTRKKFDDFCLRIGYITYEVANAEDGSSEAIKRAHTGSPIGRKRKKK